MNLRLNHICQLTLFAVAISLTTACSVNPATSKPANFGSAWQAVDCKTFDVPDIIAPQSDCGYVTVPEQHAQPNGPTIQLAVIRTRSSSKNPALDPLFVEQGGPGDSTIGDIADGAFPHYPELPVLLQSRDLIFLEERGTRYSKPFLSCPELDNHNIAVAKGEIGYTDPGWFKACNDRLKAQGINPNVFNTRENAADVYFVAETLGYPQFNYYGVSYGTLLGQYVISQADKHKAKLRSVILDGVVTPNIDFNLGAGHTMSYALRNVFHACAQDRQCAQAYPNLEQKFFTLVDQLNRKPVPITLTIPSSKQAIASQLDVNTFLIGVMHYLYRPYSDETARGSSLPKFIYAASQGNFDWLTEKLSEDLENHTSAKEMYHTVLCARANSVQNSPSQVLPPAYPQLLPIGIREAEAVKKACDILHAELKPPFVYDNPDIPTLFFNGAYDPATPQPYGEAVAKNLKTAYVYTFPGVGHGALFVPQDMPAGACSTQMAADFLANPQRAPDSSCLTQVKPRFVVE